MTIKKRKIDKSISSESNDVEFIYSDIATSIKKSNKEESIDEESAYDSSSVEEESAYDSSSVEKESAYDSSNVEDIKLVLLKKNKLMNKNLPYKIIYKFENYEQIFYMDKNDLTNKLYKEILNDNGNLYYEEMKLPKNLTAEECGFLVGDNFITGDIPVIFKLKINFIDGSRKEVLIEQNKTIKDLIEKIQTEIIKISESPLDNKKKHFIIKNGSLIDEEIKLKEIFEDEEVCDFLIR